MKSFSVSGIAAVLAVVGVCTFACLQKVANEPRARLERGASPNDTRAPENRAIASLAEQVRASEDEVRNAEQVVRKLKSERASATQAEAELSKELSYLVEKLPRLEAEFRASVDAEKAAVAANHEASERFREYCKQKDPVSDLEKLDVAIARLVRQGVRLTAKQQMDWNHVEPEVRRGILNYLRHRDHLQSEERVRASEVAKLTAKRRSLAGKIVASRARRTDGANELSSCRQILSQVPAASITAAEAVLARKSATRDRLQAQLVAAEAKRAAALAAAQKKAAEESRRLADLDRARKARAKQAAVAAAPPAATSWGSGQRSGLSNLPPVVRTLILAEAAGIDVGLDIFPEDDPITPIREAVRPLTPIGPSTTMHADGMGVTHRQGNQTLVERANGPSALYTQEGPWEAVQYSNGVVGRRYYDDSRGVTQFDFVNPNAGVRTFGEEPYWGNDFGQGWSQRVPLQ